MLAMVHPRNFMPVHGEAVHLRAHAKLAEGMGIPHDHIFILDNGDSLQMRGGKVSLGPSYDSGIIYVDGLRIGDTDPVVLRDRQKLSQDGIVTCVVTLRSRSHKVADVDVSSRGVSFASDDELLAGIEDTCRTAIDKNNQGSPSVDVLRKAVRNSLSNYLWSKTRTRPMIIPVVMEV